MADNLEQFFILNNNNIENAKKEEFYKRSNYLKPLELGGWHELADGSEQDKKCDWSENWLI